MRSLPPTGVLFGYLIVTVALAALVLWANPAIALLTGATLTITMNRALVTGGNTIGKYMLQAAIVLLGLKLDITALWQTSADYAGLIAIYVIGALLIGLAIARGLGVDRIPGTLIAAGTAICGGTTIATIAPILRAPPAQIGLTLAIVFLLNAFALLTFPAIGDWLGMSQTEFGVWAALAIHDTSSVVATAALYGDEAADVATTLKLGRTLWLIPLVLAVSMMERTHDAKLRVPGFILLFVVASAVGSIIGVPETVTGLAATGSKALLIGALFFVGTEITRTTIAQLRGRVVGQALLLWALVVPATLGAARWLA
jgi:uncharacterized integral membrane protein (TIGR00698 family)